LGGLGVTYDDHPRLIGKRAVDFLLELIELFLLGAMAESLRVNIGSKLAISLTGASWPKISGRRGRSLQPFFFSEYYAKWSFVWYKIWTDLPSSLSQSTRLTDRKTNGRTDGQLSHP